MASRKPLIDADGEVRELTAKDMAKFRPAADALPSSLKKKLGVRGPQKTPTKERITIRLSREVVDQFRALPVNPTEKRDDRHPGDGVSKRVFHDSDRYNKWGRSSRRRFWGLRGK